MGLLLETNAGPRWVNFMYMNCLQKLQGCSPNPLSSFPELASYTCLSLTVGLNGSLPPVLSESSPTWLWSVTTHIET